MLYSKTSLFICFLYNVCVSHSVMSNPMDCSPPGSSVHGVLQAGILKWVVISFSRASFRPKIEPESPALQILYRLNRSGSLWVPCPPPGDLPTQGSSPGLPRCRWILYQLSHQESPRVLEWIAYPFSRESSLPRSQIRVSCIKGRFFTSRATKHIVVYIC